MRLNFKNVLKNTSVLTALSILTVLYVLSAYFILHTTWIYENPNSYLNDHAEYYALLLSVAFFFLFLPFGITAYHYKLMKSGNTLSALIKGIFYFYLLTLSPTFLLPVPYKVCFLTHCSLYLLYHHLVFYTCGLT
jgi:hypothetical protein